MTNSIQHVGVLGMHWGHRKNRTAGEHFRDSVKQKYNVDLNKKKRTVSLKTKLKRFDDKIGTAFGMKKRKDGKWVVTPESWAKATTIGVGLGFASFALEMGARKFIASHSAESIAQAAAYANWLANG